MYRIKVKGFEKLESMRELANEFLMPSQYMMERDEEATDIPSNIDLNFGKRELYRKLSALTGEAPEWGILTGVRPVKLARELMEKEGREETLELLKKTYLLDHNKANLLLDMVSYQKESVGIASPDSLAVYIGIPFCPTRCLYCSFASNQENYDQIEDYLRALLTEIKEVSFLIKEKGLKIESIYVGGGTPTTLNHRDMEKLLFAINYMIGYTKSRDSLKEFTLEAGRPDTVDKEKFNILKIGGVDRISINPQSMKNHTLEAIGRNHSPEDIRRAYTQAKEIGFKTINCDLIAGLPGENTEDLVYSLAKVLDMGAENITIHSLAVKKASKLISQDPNYHYHHGKVVKDMLKKSSHILKVRGYKPYYLYRQKNMAGSGENTGYSLPGHEGIYNIRIMDETQSVLALGAGGISKVYYPRENRLERVANVTNYRQYIDRLDEMIERKRNNFFEL